jgi:hypothetical protein
MQSGRIAFLLFLSTSAAACASLLGDFNSGTPGGEEEGGTEGGTVEGGPDASPESSRPDSYVPAEASNDSQSLDTSLAETSAESGIPLVLLNCQTWKYPQPVLVQSLDGMAGSSAGDFDGVKPFPAGATTTRVVAGRYGANLFSVYEIDSSHSPPSVASVDVPYVGVANSAYVVATPRLMGGFGVVISYTDSQGFVDVDLYPFRDGSPISPLPAPIRIYQTQEINTNMHGTVLEVAPSKYFAVLSTFGTANSTYALQVGLVSGAPANMLTIDSSPQNNFGPPVAVHVGSSVFVFVFGSGGPALYQVADTGTSGGSRQTVSRGAGAGTIITGQFTDSVPGSAPNTTNVGYMELDVNEAGTAFGVAPVLATAVDDSKLPTLALSDLSFGKSYTDLGSVPGPLNPGRFFGDDFVAIAPGLDSQSDPTSWVNFLWLDMHGVVRGDQSGINGLLPGTGTIINQNAASIGATPGPRTAQQAAWNVVWAENDRDDAGLIYNSLFYNELDCTP